MFDNLTEKLSGTFRQLTGKAVLSPGNIEDALREVRGSLIEADVALVVVKDFIESIRSRSVGQEVAKSLNPSQALIKIVQAELELIMGEQSEELHLKLRLQRLF
jgi:signal recognition particle subunit SRP54